MPYDGYGHWVDETLPEKHIDDIGSPYGTKSTNIDSGIRKTLNTCQYWIKGMPGVCKNWTPGDPGNCTYEKLDNETKLIIRPDGYNLGLCDLLGRKYGCNKYESSGDDLEQYICVATCPYRSGLWKRDDENEPWRSVRSSEIRGHNAEQDSFVGRCDGCGFGRSDEGWSRSSGGSDCSAESFAKLPVICNYYRPYHMGFGAKEPKTSTLHSKRTKATIDKTTGRLLGDERDSYGERLPFSFRVYNVRAKLQKCAYWDAAESYPFKIDNGIHLDPDEDKCSNPDEVATPYHTKSSDAPPSDMMLKDVWAEAGGVICNGTRSDCPGYTGKWIYCIDEMMEKGDKISAQQILELRFWMNDWADQEEYDSVFKKPPNKHDPDTSDIYTYGRWEVISTTPAESVLMGRKCSLCIPNTRNEFSKDVIKVEEVKFINKGTSAPADASQMHFPSLIRNIEDWAFPPLNIIYPYASKDPFKDEEDNEPCSEKNKEDVVPCIKRSHKIDGDSVSVVGWSVRNTVVYVFNSIVMKENGVTIPSIIEEATGSLEIQTTEKIIKLDEEMEELIEELTEKELIYKSTSNTNGLFIVGPVDLEYRKLNELYVCYKYSDTWYFRKREVWSQWHGGVVIQSEFKHEYGDSAYIDDGYHIFTPEATAAAKMYPLHSANKYNCETSSADAFAANWQLVSSSITDFSYRYSYCIKKTTVENFEVTRWRRADNAGTLWMEIDDTNLNYIFEWGVTKVKAELRDEEDKVVDTIEMRQVFPTGSHTQINIHANACMIAPSDPSVKKGFFKEANWTILVDYWYKFISNDNSESEDTEVVFPPIGDSLLRFQPPSYSLSLSGDIIDASGIMQNTVAVCGRFADEDGRLIGVFATKLVVDVARVLCRDVEIRYGWKASGTIMEVRPQQGFLRREKDGPFRTVSVGDMSSGSTPPCGDHEHGLFSGIGPMWFPYSSCEKMDFYDIWTGANSVVQPHEETPRDDYRFMGPIEHYPFCEPHSTLWDCAEDWGCSYNKINTVSTVFTGYANYRGRVSAEVYNAEGWELPKFGNVLRESVERFRSIDNISHISFKGPEPAPSVAWAPLVMDDSCFFTDFNSINGNVLTYINQFNFMKIVSNVSESVNKENRQTFDDVFGSRRMIYASYPGPLTEDPATSIPYVAYYYFKDDSTQWAWQEKWKDIEKERGTLSLVSWQKPDYIFDKDKMEHRFIISEGTHVVRFTPPVFDDEECRLQKWPSIQLGGGERRYFKCIYDDYNSSLVEWEDENEGEVGGSGGGSADKSIYEKTTTNSNWIHSKPDSYPGLNNMLYDNEATDDIETARNDEREIFITYDSLLDDGDIYVYNRGLIANIYKSSLKYMPFDKRFVSHGDYEVSTSPSTNIDDPGSIANWKGVGTATINLNFTKECTPCVCTISIQGYEGNQEIRYEGEDIKVSFSRPSITIYENGDTEPAAQVLSPFQTQEEMNAGMGTKTWSKEISIEVNPTRMLGSDPKKKASRTQSLSIVLSAPDGIAINHIGLESATYKSETENLKIYERKYIVSTGSVGDFNMDGENKAISYEYDRDNSGVYFFDNNVGDGKLNAYNKMRSIVCNENHEDLESLKGSLTNYGDVIEAEQEQKKLYDAAKDLDMGSTTRYKTIIPPNMIEFFEKAGAYASSFAGKPVNLVSHVRKWDNVPEAQGYEVFPVWWPRGFLYRWASEHKTTRCYIVGPLRKIAQLEFVDVYYGEEIPAATGLQSYYSLRSWHMLLKTEKNLMIGTDQAQDINDTQFAGFSDLITK